MVLSRLPLLLALADPPASLVTSVAQDGAVGIDVDATLPARLLTA